LAGTASAVTFAGEVKAERSILSSRGHDPGKNGEGTSKAACKMNCAFTSSAVEKDGPFVREGAIWSF